MRRDLNRMASETYKLVKRDGVLIEDIRTPPISDGLCVVFRDDIDFEEGDILERKLPSGRIEQSEIIESEFYNTFGGIPAHFQLKVRNTKRPSTTPIPQNITYNLNGPNSRVNNHSTDSSYNVIDIEPSDLFKKVEEALTGNVSDANDLKELKQQIAEMRNNQGNSSFTTSYVKFMEMAADHMTVLTPFLPALAQLLVLATNSST